MAGEYEIGFFAVTLVADRAAHLVHGVLRIGGDVQFQVWMRQQRLAELQLGLAVTGLIDVDLID